MNIPSDQNLKSIVLEYTVLASLSTLTDEQADRLKEILTLAQQDEVLTNWLNEMDHVLGHALGFIEEGYRDSDKDVCALLREHRGENIREISPGSNPSRHSSKV